MVCSSGVLAISFVATATNRAIPTGGGGAGGAVVLDWLQAERATPNTVRANAALPEANPVLVVRWRAPIIVDTGIRAPDLTKPLRPLVDGNAQAHQPEGS